MKITLVFLVLVGLLVGCASVQPVGMLYSGGNFYNGATTVDANSSGSTTKTGKACATSILALFAIGDNSVEAAKKNGVISKVTSIDYKVFNILGVYGTYCTVVKGE